MNARVMPSLRRFAALAALCALATPALRAQTPNAAPPVPWAKVSVTLPPSGFGFPPAEGSRLAEGACLICHSAGMVLRQPPLTQAQWLAEVQKMRRLWGSPLPIAEEPALAAYLARINGPARSASAPK